MGKFGKKNVVSSDLSSYMIGIMAPSGFGKTTLMYEACEKLYGDKGYLVLDMGTEKGIDAIEDIVYEHVDNYGTLNEIVNDIVKNKVTDYPKLKVVVLDTLDAYFDVVEEYVIKAWNAEHANEKEFKKATSINSVEGGYGRGMDRVIEVAKKIITRLNSVGVGVWYTAHVKEKEQSDLYTGAVFTSITANMNSKYFNSIKNSTHAIGCGYYDRTIEKIEVGEENPVTKKKKERSARTNETRKIKFRDDMLVADAKSRFKYIIDEIPLDTDAFIKAISDAIEASRKHKGDSVDKVQSAPKTEISDTIKKMEAALDYANGDDLELDEPPFDTDDKPFDKTAIIAFIRDNYKGLIVEAKTEIKQILDGQKLEAIDDEETLKKIANIVESSLRPIE